MSEDLGIKVGTPEEAFWTSVEKKAKEDVIAAKHQIEISELIIEFAVKKIAAEVKLRTS